MKAERRHGVGRMPRVGVGHVRAAARVVVLSARLVAAVPAFGQFDNTTRSVSKRGTTAADFLGIPVGARATGMGSAITASVDDLSSLYWNPGGLSLLNGGAA